MEAASTPTRLSKTQKDAKNSVVKIYIMNACICSICICMYVYTVIYLEEYNNKKKIKKKLFIFGC